MKHHYGIKPAKEYEKFVDDTKILFDLTVFPEKRQNKTEIQKNENKKLLKLADHHYQPRTLGYKKI